MAGRWFAALFLAVASCALGARPAFTRLGEPLRPQSLAETSGAELERLFEATRGPGELPRDDGQSGAATAQARATTASVTVGIADVCEKDRAKGMDCALWSDEERGRKGLKTGDMIFFRGATVRGKVQRMITRKDVTHVGMVIWNQWIESQSMFVYVPTWEKGAVLTLMEVSNHSNRDIETEVEEEGFQNGDAYQKLQHQPEGTRVFIRPLKAPLDEKKLGELMTISACMHTRRPKYLKWSARSENPIAKFPGGLLKLTRERSELYKYMFCSQFTSLVIMAWTGPLKMGGPNKVPVPWHGGDPEKVLLPGDFDPGDVKDIENGMFGEVYQLQLPYAQYTEYHQEAVTQHILLEQARASLRQPRHFAEQCRAGISSISYVTRFLPSWLAGLSSAVNDLSCSTPCEARQHTFVVSGDAGVVLRYSLPVQMGQCLTGCDIVLAMPKDVTQFVTGDWCKKGKVNVTEAWSSHGELYQLCCAGFLGCSSEGTRSLQHNSSAPL